MNLLHFSYWDKIIHLVLNHSHDSNFLIGLNNILQSGADRINYSLNIAIYTVDNTDLAL